MVNAGGARAIAQPAVTVLDPDDYSGERRNQILSDRAGHIQRLSKDICLQIQAIAQSPGTLANAAHAAWNCGLPNAVKDLADLVEGFGGVPLMDVIRTPGMQPAASTTQALAKEHAE
jgi:UDP-N-acetylglucosamine--N-acetylmuramyl-(pentapeptide) pyrophosphoryl-undecaprenol N-acetylglucosamine transferase